MPDQHSIDLSVYRINHARETLQVSEECFKHGHYKDSMNRSYYAAFYATRAVLAIEGADYKKHKDVIAHFNQYYVATGKFDKALGRKLARLKQKREQSDYDDFFVASADEARVQLENAEEIIRSIEKYLSDVLPETENKDL